MQNHYSVDSLALHTDLYQINMAETYWEDGVHERKAVFELFFRKLPFGNGYAVFAGLERAIQSVPVPSAIPMSASLNAGASLIPSTTLSIVVTLRKVRIKHLLKLYKSPFTDKHFFHYMTLRVK